MGDSSSPARGWTPKYIESLKPRRERYEITDPTTPGLVLRVHPSGVRSFRWYVRSLDRVVVIGPWSFSEKPAHVTLKQAKDWLARLKEARAAGEAQLNAELAALRNQLAPPMDASADRRLFGTVAEEFYSDDIARNRKRPEQARRILDRDILPVLGARPLAAITTLDCRDVVKRAVDRGAPVHAGRVLAVLKQLLNWAQANGFTDRNPAAPLRGRHLGVVENVSDRWLTEKEIPLFWRALDGERGPTAVERPDPRTGKVQRYAQRLPTLAPATAAALKLLLLTGVRTGELLRARWANVDFAAATWTIPVADQKLTKEQERRAKPFVVPLSPTAVELFEGLREIARAVRVASEDGEGAKESPWVMASPGADGGHYTDKTLSRAMTRLQTGQYPALALPGGLASPHDLRRTMRTHLGKLRVPLHVVERCLNHSLGRIVQTYDVGDYLDERREALDKWDSYVRRLLAPEQSNVIVLPAS